MNLIDICIMTIIVSFIMRIKAKLEIYKDIHDLGYKFNHKKLQELNDKEDENIDIVTKILEDYYMYIPFYNLLVDAIRDTNYIENKDNQIERLKRVGAIEEMTAKEKEKYNERKTGFHAIKMEKEKMLRLSRASLAEFPNGNKIWFDFKEDITEEDSFTDIIEIVEVEGPCKKSSEEDLKKLVYYSLIVTGDDLISKIKSESTEEELNDPKKQDKVIEEVVDIEFEIPNTPKEEEHKPKTRIRRP